VGSRFDDWIYWHFFTITFDYNSSHIELLLDKEISHYCLNLGLNSHLLLVIPETALHSRGTDHIEHVMLYRRVTTQLPSNQSRRVLLWQWTPYCCHAVKGEGVYRPLHRNGSSSIDAATMCLATRRLATDHSP
jgi:hypothetical protein